MLKNTNATLLVKLRRSINQNTNISTTNSRVNHLLIIDLQIFHFQHTSQPATLRSYGRNVDVCPRKSLQHHKEREREDQIKLRRLKRFFKHKKEITIWKRRRWRQALCSFGLDWIGLVTSESTRLPDRPGPEGPHRDSMMASISASMDALMPMREIVSAFRLGATILACPRGFRSCRRPAALGLEEEKRVVLSGSKN